MLALVGCGSKPDVPKTSEAASIRASVRDDAFRIMNALSFYASEFNDGKVPAWSTTNPPDWWKSDPNSKRLTEGVQYRLADEVEGKPVSKLDPQKPLLVATGKPIVDGYGKSEIVITTGLLPDPENHANHPLPDEPK